MALADVGGALAKASDAVEDVIGALGPDKRLGIFVVYREVVANGSLELQGAAMRAALDLLFSEQGEPTFHLINPGCRGGRKVDMKAWVARKPGPYGSGFVSAVIVHD